MPYLVDTDMVIDHLAGEEGAVKLFSKLAQEGIAISMITYMETFQGTLREPDPKEAQAKLDFFLQAAPIMPFSRSVARRCAKLRETQKTENKRVRARALDLMNAATALEYNLTLVARNVEDYDDISDLKLYELPPL